MRLTLVMPDPIAGAIERLAAQPIECGGFLLVRPVQTGEQLRLLARQFVPVPPEHYEMQAPDEMVVRSAGYVPALALAERDGDVAIWFHTHPGKGSMPLPSAHDRRVDDELAETVRIRTGQPYYGALIASPAEHGAGFRFSGHIASPTKTTRIDRVWVVGDRLHLVPAENSTLGVPPARYDRNVRAFGTDIQTALGHLTVGVVGCGGTGSAVIEQLARLGVRDFVLIDPKALTDSNVTRVYGSIAAHVGRDKVAIAESNVRAIAPDVHCTALRGDLKSQAAARALAGCDVVFGCTDDEAGRLVLSRLSTYLLCPVIDCGVLVSSGRGGLLEGIDGRVTVLAPGAACLVCRSRIDMLRAAAQFLPQEEHAQLEAEGYAPALGDVEPAVVTFTTSVAAAAVNELLERMIGFGPQPRPSEILLRFHEREISTNRALPRDRHYCHPDAGKWGQGDTTPFLDLSWPS